MITLSSPHTFPGISDAETSQVADALGLSGEQRDQCKFAVERLYNLFVKYDGTLLEINPLAELTDGRGLLFFIYVIN